MKPYERCERLHFLLNSFRMSRSIVLWTVGMFGVSMSNSLAAFFMVSSVEYSVFIPAFLKSATIKQSGGCMGMLSSLQVVSR